MITEEIKGLDKAAKEYASEYPADRPDQMIAEMSFKAGAEWMAKKGIERYYFTRT